MNMKEIEGIPTLMYHSLVHKREPWHHTTVIEIDAFRRQMQFLVDEKYTFLTIAQAQVLLSGKESLNKKVVLTFDDGYQSYVNIVQPILESMDAPATLFLYTDTIGELSHTQSILKNGDIPGSDLPLTTENIKCLLKSDWQIEAHSCSHLNHSNLSTQEIEQEMVGSKEQIEGITGTFPRFYAYPFGKYNKQTLSEAKKHYEAGFTTHQGLWKRGDDPFRTPRIDMNHLDDLHIFEQKLKTGYASRQLMLLDVLKRKWRSSVWRHDFLSQLM
jgi:peptidoglycan/xylan/chitin deacetylase (PgdA/CDA1 family)